MHISQKTAQTSGFTLIGLLIITVFFLLMMGVITRSTQEANKNAQHRDSQRIHTLESIQAALAEYYTEHGAYPPPTETFAGWERSGCSEASCTDVPAPFMEYLSTEATLQDPSLDMITPGYELDWGYLYQSGMADEYQSYCLMTHLETRDFQNTETDASCDDGYADTYLNVGGDTWWYAVNQNN
ncbi:type II secretion system protein [candidate division WWE3 bacterium]|uniref:Type II secretion system protein n=1 Tax=candidate division WWE3 bacterium TaxID=2053526 RepID=A0A955LGC2_UNCKA|nr:type II secretion system protein [candidate division WWE3 bacterium]